MPAPGQVKGPDTVVEPPGCRVVAVEAPFVGMPVGLAAVEGPVVVVVLEAIVGVVGLGVEVVVGLGVEVVMGLGVVVVVVGLGVDVVVGAVVDEVRTVVGDVGVVGVVVLVEWVVGPGVHPLEQGFDGIRFVGPLIVSTIFFVSGNRVL